jgi:hypothetical protein
MTLEEQVRRAVVSGWGNSVLMPGDVAKIEAIVREVVQTFTPIRDPGHG